MSARLVDVYDHNYRVILDHWKSGVEMQVWKYTADGATHPVRWQFTGPPSPELFRDVVKVCLREVEHRLSGHD